MNKKAKKLLLFGGSFDPPHLGHKAMLEAALLLVNPDLVLIMPCYIQPLKIENSASAKHRLKMAKLMFPEKKYVVSDHEIEKGGKSYTVDTLRYLKREYKGHEIYVLIGEDSYSSLQQWKDFEKLLSDYNIVVVARQGHGLKDKFPFAKDITFISDFSHPASSTSARAGDLKYIDPKVIEYIKANDLYKE